MAATFKVPKSPAKSILTIDNFLGVDFTNSPANIEDSKSPNSKNMIRDVPGKVRKCMGYKTLDSYYVMEDDEQVPLKINGCHLLRGDKTGFIHAGTNIYWDKIWLYDSANDERSKAWQFEKKLYMLDGKELLCLYGEKQDDITTTTGKHTRHIEYQKTFSENVTLKTDDFITFYLPYACCQLDVAYDGNTDTITLADVTEYTFENTYGDYDFTLTFTATLDTETKSFDRLSSVSTGNIGPNSECEFTLEASEYFPDRYITSLKLDYRDEGEAKTVTITPPTQSNSFTWTNTLGEREYTATLSDDEGAYPLSTRIGGWTNLGYRQTATLTDMIGESTFALNKDESLRVSAAPTSPGRWAVDVYVVATCTHEGSPLTITKDVMLQGDRTPDAFTISAELFDGINEDWTITTLEAFSTGIYSTNGNLNYTPHVVESVEIADTSNLVGDLVYVVNGAIVDGIIDGRSGEFIDDEGYKHKVSKVTDNAYIPTLTISKDPEGGGEAYEDLNLLTPAFTELFLGKPAVVDYNMSFDNLDETEPEVYLLDEDGEWQKQTYGTDYTCDYETGVVTFTTAPGESPVTGEDNVKITAYHTVEGYADRINKCTIGILYGVNGASDRLFVSGNPDYINYDWYSGQYDPTYFTDTSYSMLGTSGSAIVGYSIISNYLAAHKDYMEKDQNIILREGDLVDSEPSFRIINTLQGAGAIAPHSFAYLATEPLFLTRQGVYAVTAQDVTGEKYAQNRSYFIDGQLLEEPNLEEAFGFVYKDMYWLCVNDVAYILDGLQALHTDRSKPYATRQYAAFYRTNLPARIMWEEDGALYFGTEDGRVCKFNTDKYALESYNDDGEPIEAVWETPDIDGKLFYKNKTLRYIALRLDSALATSVNIYVMNRGLWQFIKKDDTSGRYLSFKHLVFSKLSFSGDKTQHTFSTKVRVKKVDKFRLRVTNDDLNEPFGLYNIAFEYVENGNYKG